MNDTTTGTAADLSTATIIGALNLLAEAEKASRLSDPQWQTALALLGARRILHTAQTHAVVPRTFDGQIERHAVHLALEILGQVYVDTDDRFIDEGMTWLIAEDVDGDDYDLIRDLLRAWHDVVILHGQSRAPFETTVAALAVLDEWHAADRDRFALERTEGATPWGMPSTVNEAAVLIVRRILSQMEAE
jgi:hypothetical protein